VNLLRLSFLIPHIQIKWDGNANQIIINDERFTPAGILVPKSKADLAFVMHALAWLATNGTAAIVSFPGVLYRGGAEQKIRQYLIDNNFIDAVIQLPTDLFFGTSIGTCILVLKKNKSDTKTLFIDANQEFIRGAAKNKLTNLNAEKILDCYAKRETHKHFSRLVDYPELVPQNYNLSVSNYVTQKDMREMVDITQLNSDISQMVQRQSELRQAIDEIVGELEREA
jgi:type I restriction enzyme M protein